MQKQHEKKMQQVEVTQIIDRTILATQPSQADVDSLVESINQVGLIQSIVVRPVTDGIDTYEVVVGQGRLNAVRQLGHQTIPAIIMELDDDEAMLMALGENYCRRQIKPCATAHYLQKLQDKGMSLREIAPAMGCSHQTVKNYLSLLDLPEDIQKLVDDEQLNMTTALAVGAEINRVIEQAKSEGIELRDEDQKQLKQNTWDSVEEKLKGGERLSSSNAAQLVYGGLTEELKTKLFNAVEKKRKQNNGKQQEKVGPEVGGGPVLECRLPKKDLLYVLGCELQGEERIIFTFTSDKLTGPAGEVPLDIAPTMEGEICLHSTYAHALYLMVDCPDTKGNEVTLTMSRRATCLQVTSSAEAGLECKLPAHLKIGQKEPVVYGPADVDHLLPQSAAEGEGVYYLRTAPAVVPPRVKVAGGAS